VGHVLQDTTIPRTLTPFCFNIDPLLLRTLWTGTWRQEDSTACVVAELAMETLGSGKLTPMAGTLTMS